MVTITVVNQKGGVCKTTLCRNLGYLLATQYHKRVLLIDLDSSGNLSYFFGFPTGSKVECGASKVIANVDLDPMTAIEETRVEGLFLLSGSESLGRTEREISSDTAKPQQGRLRFQLNKVQSQFDYCLIDCPPTVSDSVLVYNALVSSDQVLIPCVATHDSVHGVGKVVSMVSDVNQWWNDRLTIRGVVFCRIGRKTLDRELVKLRLPVPRFRTYIRESSAVAEYSREMNVTFHEYNAAAPGSRDMDNLAAELIGAEFPYPEELPEELDEFMGA